ncbi:MucB/RseB C-terminal domain-containing protein [uncultured Marinobacter sp.]|uniref:MucB/RseB C-terminal domain-containing protein n=1 Tax=uncultured Marinobacter sp. TaxID=187379 RepID=UPI0030DA993F
MAERSVVQPAVLLFAGYQRLLRSLALVLALLAAPLTAAADSETAEAWLMKLGPALKMTSYRGVFVYSRGDQVSSMMIAHRYRNGQVEERLVLQDGASGEILRRGNRVVCVLPEHGRIQLDQVIPSGPFAEAFASQLVPMASWYAPQVLGDDRIAGYSSVVIALNPRDQHRYGYRLWLEKQTGLLLKSQVRQGEDVLERFQFTMLEITDDLPDSDFEIQSEGRTTELSSPLEPDAEKADRHNRMAGWSLGWRPAGFVPSASPRTGRGQAVAFSDGVAAFSVFVEPVGDLAMPTGVSRIGATSVYMHHVTDNPGANLLVTVVGEIPPATAMKVAESVIVADSDALTGARRD